MTIAPQAPYNTTDTAGTGRPSRTRGGIRILYVATSLGDGGIERSAAELAVRVKQHGFTVEALTAQGSFFGRQCLAAGVDVRPVVNRNAADFAGAVRMADQIRDFRADIVHVHSRRDFVAAMIGTTIARRREARPIRLILHSHLDKPLGSLHWLSGRLATATVDCIIGVSTSVKDRLVRTHRLDRDLVRLLYNGIDLSRFAASPDTDARQRAAIRAELGVAPDDRVIGMIGRLEDKGQERLLARLEDIRRAIPKARLLLIGSGKEETQRRIEKAAAKDPSLIVMGRVSDVPSVLPAIDVLAHLPKTESFGLALVEAMAAGIPTVAAAVGGCREIVVDGETGYLVSPHDDKAAVDAITRLLADNAGELRRRMGEAARVVARSFTLDRQVETLVDWYFELAAAL